MKPSEIYVGLKVVTNKTNQATIYTVEQIIDKFTVLLVYEKNKIQWMGGVVDISMLSLPTIEQMANA